MPLIWQTGDGNKRRSSRVNQAVPTLAATEAAADSAIALESLAAEVRIVEERRRRKEVDRADAEEAEDDDLGTRSADGAGCSGVAGSNAQADAGEPPIRAAATPAATAPLQPAELPPSAVVHLGATSSMQQFFYSILQPACRQISDNDDDMWSDATFEPLLSVPPSTGALALANECIAVLHAAYAEGLKFSASEVLTARATFMARSECPETTVALFPHFQQLYTPPRP